MTPPAPRTRPANMQWVPLRVLLVEPSGSADWHRYTPCATSLPRALIQAQERFGDRLLLVETYTPPRPRHKETRRP